MSNLSCPTCGLEIARAQQHAGSHYCPRCVARRRRISRMAALRPGELWLEERGVDARRTLVLAGDLDAATAPVLRERIARLCSPHISELTLDLGDVTLIEAHGTEALLAARACCEGYGCEFSATGVRRRTGAPPGVTCGRERVTRRGMSSVATVCVPPIGGQTPTNGLEPAVYPGIG